MHSLCSPNGPGSPGGPCGPGSPGEPFPGTPGKPASPGGPGGPVSPNFQVKRRRWLLTCTEKVDNVALAESAKFAGV